MLHSAEWFRAPQDCANKHLYVLMAYLNRSVPQHVDGEGAEVVSGYERNQNSKYESLDKSDVRAGNGKQEGR